MAINYPNSLDNNDTLYLVHDALRVVLSEDYNPGDTFITVDPDPILLQFPPTGIITLTDQCSDIGLRAISFSYKAVDAKNNLFTGLTLLSGFTDVVKPKRFTDVTLNVTAPHHDNLKDALIAT